ncbi:MAG: CoA ester lyase [Hyphomicrobiales bacterium]|nr:MAG: CoA ester lyase [Hyphomicrobiales bacterium]
MKLRSLLYVPAHAERFLAKAHERGADAIILDLEDAVPEADKDAARNGLRESVKAVGRNGARVLVRINAGARRRADADAAKAAGASAIVLAKARLDELDDIALPVIAMLEDAASILDARAYAKHANVMGLLVGSEDLATSLGGEPTPEVLRFPKLLAHYAAKAEGKLSLGLLRSVADFKDLPAIEAAGREARAHGFDGATCVHPSVVPLLNVAFTPTAEEIAWAGRVIEAAKGGEGAFTVDGRMVDAPVITRARRILEA